MSINNKLIVIFSGVTMFATAIYSGFAGWQLYAMRGQLAEMHKQRIDSEDAQAAKLSIEDISTIVKPCNKTSCYEVSFALWNRGNSIATNITGNIQPLYGPHPDIWKQLCADVKPSHLGFSLPQGGKFPTPYTNTFEGEEWYWVINFVYLDEFGRVQSLPACLYPHHGRATSCLPERDDPKYQNCGKQPN